MAFFIISEAYVSTTTMAPPTTTLGIVQRGQLS